MREVVIYIDSMIDNSEQIESGRGHYIQANGLNIYYEEHGQGKPLLLVHGGAGGIGTRSVSPALSPTPMKMLLHTVKKVSGRPAASRTDTPLGMGRQWRSSTAQNSA